jgi:hypothetical protein
LAAEGEMRRDDKEGRRGGDNLVIKDNSRDEPRAEKL